MFKGGKGGDREMEGMTRRMVSKEMGKNLGEGSCGRQAGDEFFFLFKQKTAYEIGL